MMQLFKNFTFTQPEFGSLLFSDPDQISLDFKYHKAILRLQSDGDYDIESEVTDARWVRSAISAPSKCRKLKLLQSVIEVPTDTLDGYLLGDGTNAYKWSGATWDVVDPDLKASWNTEAEINEGIESFPYFTNYCVYIRLGTDDADVAPILTEVIVLFEADILSWDESMMQHTLLRRIEADVELITDVAYKTTAAGSTLNFDTIIEGVNESINFIEPVQVFNLDDDPNLLTDLFSSYAAPTITLTGSVASGKQLMVRASCAVPVRLEGQSPDYVEVEQCPSITLSEEDERNFHNYPNVPSIVDKANKLAYEATYSKRLELQVNVTIITSVMYDLFRLQDALNKFVEDNRVLLDAEIDVPMNLTQTSAFRNITPPNVKGFFTSMGLFFIVFNVTSGSVVTKPIITSVNYTLEG
jgi:hypothetical protein